MPDIWLLACSPDADRTAVHLGDVAPGDAGLVTAVRAAIGAPAGDQGLTGWDLQLVDGEPHPDWLKPGRVFEWRAPLQQGTPDDVVAVRR